MLRKQTENGEMLGAMRKRGRRERGQSLVEFALILPVMVILVLGIVDFGMGLRSYIALSNSAREGARFAAVGSPAGSFPSNCNGSNNTTVIGRTCVAMSGLHLPYVQTVSVTYPDGQAVGKSVVVTTSYNYHYITPIADFANFFSAGSFPDTLNLQASTTMRLE